MTHYRALNGKRWELREVNPAQTRVIERGGATTFERKATELEVVMHDQLKGAVPLADDELRRLLDSLAHVRGESPDEGWFDLVRKLTMARRSLGGQ